MCLKESVTNVVKHSQATKCTITIKQSKDEWTLEIIDDGIGIPHKKDTLKEHGLRGMRERLEFVNGTLDIMSDKGTKIMIRVPNVIKQDD